MSEIILEQTSKQIVIETSSGSGGGGTLNSIVAITQPSDFVLRIQTNEFTDDFELFQGPQGIQGVAGTNGTNGLDGNGITSITQPSDLVLRVATDEFTNDFALFAGPQGEVGPSSLEPFIDAPEELEHFTGYRGGADLSLVFGTQTANSTIVQATADNTAFKSISIVRNTLTPTTGNTLTQFRKSSVFLPTYNPLKQDFLFELGFAIPQLPTAAENFQVEISAVSTANNTGFTNSPAGIAARLEFNASAGRAAFVLETRSGSVSSTAIAATTVAINTGYKMRLRLNQPSGTAQLLVNGTVVATLGTNLPTVLLMKRILFFKTAGTGSVIADYDYHFDKITYL